jgi:cellulose biosynthesis protein BcsQ
MQSLGFLTQKGGSGKTTLALHVAVAALEDGARVVLVDTDPQESATAWKGAREAEDPVVVTVGADRVAEVQAAARDDGMSLCIIDSAPHAGAVATKLARSADLVVIPCRPDAIDLAAVGAAMDIVQAAGVPAVSAGLRLRRGAPRVIRSVPKLWLTSPDERQSINIGGAEEKRSLKLNHFVLHSIEGDPTCFRQF